MYETFKKAIKDKVKSKKKDYSFLLDEFNILNYANRFQPLVSYDKDGVFNGEFEDEYLDIGNLYYYPVNDYLTDERIKGAIKNHIGFIPFEAQLDKIDYLSYLVQELPAEEFVKKFVSDFDKLSGEYFDRVDEKCSSIEDRYEILNDLYTSMINDEKFKNDLIDYLYNEKEKSIIDFEDAIKEINENKEEYQRKINWFNEAYDADLTIEELIDIIQKNIEAFKIYTRDDISKRTKFVEKFDDLDIDWGSDFAERFKVVLEDEDFYYDTIDEYIENANLCEQIVDNSYSIPDDYVNMVADYVCGPIDINDVDLHNKASLLYSLANSGRILECTKDLEERDLLKTIKEFRLSERAIYNKLYEKEKHDHQIRALRKETGLVTDDMRKLVNGFFNVQGEKRRKNKEKKGKTLTK